MFTSLTFLIWRLALNENFAEGMEKILEEGFLGGVFVGLYLFLFFSSFVSAYQLDRAIIKLLTKKGEQNNE